MLRYLTSLAKNTEAVMRQHPLPRLFPFFALGFLVFGMAISRTLMWASLIMVLMYIFSRGVQKVGIFVFGAFWIVFSFTFLSISKDVFLCLTLVPIHITILSWVFHWIECDECQR